MSDLIHNRLVVLGHSGYIGRHLAAHVKARHPGITLLCYSKEEIDLTYREQAHALESVLEPEDLLIVLSGIKKQYGDSMDIFEQNVSMIANLCRVLAVHPVARVVYFSSAEVYGDSANNLSITEETPIAPTTYYGLAKCASEGLFRKAVGQSGRPLLVLRPALIYGPNESNGGYGPGAFASAAAAGVAMTLWGDGSELRDFVHVDDLVTIVAYLAFACDYQGTLNIASGVSRSFREAARLAVQFAGKHGTIGSRPRTRPQVNQGFDISLLRKQVPELRLRSLESGLGSALGRLGNQEASVP